MISLLLFPTLVWGLPGWFATRLAFPSSRGLERLALALVLGMALVVPTGFAVSFLPRRMLSPETLLAIAGAWTALLAGLDGLRRRRAPAASAPPHPGEWLQCLVAVGATAGLTLLEAPRAVEASEVFAPCPHQSSFYLLEDGRGTGVATWDIQWERRVTHFMEHALEPGYGMQKALTYQRVGSTSTLVEPVAFFGAGGFVVATLVYYALVVLFGTLLVRAGLNTAGLAGRRWDLAAIAVAAAFLVGVRAIATYTVNENVLALGLSMATLHLVGRRRGEPLDAAQAVFAGAVFALCLATRPMCVGLVPALAWLLLRDRAWRPALVFAAVLPVFAAAFLVAHQQIFGIAVTDPSLLQVRTNHTFLGFAFRFHPLIWPFSDAVFRSGNEPFPLLLQVPLEHLGAFGLGLGLLILAGIALGPVREVAPRVLWGLPGYALMMSLVSLDHHKQSYALTAVGALPWLAGTGLGQLAAWVQRLRGLPVAAPGPKRLVVAAVFAALGLASPLLVRGLEFPVDPRPQYNDEVGTYDDPPVEAKRDRLTRPGVLPRATFDVGTAWGAWRLLRTAEWAQRGAGEVATSPVFVWKQLPEIRTRFVAQTTDAPDLPPYLGDLGGGLELTDSLGLYSLRLPAGPATVVMASDGHRVALEVTTSGAQTLGWLTVGLVDDGIENVQEVELFIDGQRVAPVFHTLTVGDHAPVWRVAANHDIALEPQEFGDTLGFEVQQLPTVGAVDAADPAAGPCRAMRWKELDVRVGGGGYRVTAGPSPLALRVSRVFPPDPDPCPLR